MLKERLQIWGSKIYDVITRNHNYPDFFITHPAYLNGRQLVKAITDSKDYIRGLVLDIGSGSTPYEKCVNDRQIRYFSLEYPHSSKIINKNCKNNGPSMHGDARNLGTKSCSVDTILLTQVLEHIDEPDVVLIECHRILKVNGFLIISVPFIYQLHLQPFDFFRFSEFGIRHLLNKHGFHIEKFMYNGYFGTALITLINSFLFSITSRNILYRVMCLPLLCFVCFPLTNLIGLLLDKISATDFSPNFWIIAKKVSAQ